MYSYTMLSCEDSHNYLLLYEQNKCSLLFTDLNVVNLQGYCELMANFVGFLA
jgi:hypothetical protein